MHHLKVIVTENSTIIALPAEIVVQLGLAPGEWASIEETADGLLIGPADAEFQKANGYR